MKEWWSPVLSFNAPSGCTEVQELFSPTVPCTVTCASGRQRDTSHPALPFMLLTGRKKPPSPLQTQTKPWRGAETSIGSPSPSVLQVLQQSLERSWQFLMLQQHKIEYYGLWNASRCLRASSTQCWGTTTNPDILLPIRSSIRKKSRKGM